QRRGARTQVPHAGGAGPAALAADPDQGGGDVTVGQPGERLLQGGAVEVPGAPDGGGRPGGGLGGGRPGEGDEEQRGGEQRGRDGETGVSGASGADGAHTRLLGSGGRKEERKEEGGRGWNRDHPGDHRRPRDPAR